MTWQFYRIRTVDGLKLEELPVVDFSWARSVRDGQMNAPTSQSAASLTSIDFPLEALFEAGIADPTQPGWQARLNEAFLPLKYGIAAYWDDTPICMGIIGSPRDDKATSLGITLSGVTSILGSRYVVPENFSATGSLVYSGLSLGTIAKRVVQAAMAKPGGALPIIFDDDVTVTSDDAHTRTYDAYNVANLSASKLIDAISNVDGGPDIDFRPVEVDSQHLSWHMVTGGETDPYIPQSTTPVWEEGSDSVETVAVKTSAEYLAHRIYGVGDGTDEGTRLVKVEALDQTAQKWPLIEAVKSDTSWNTDALLTTHAKTYVSDHPLQQVTMTVRADGVTPLGRFWPGMMCSITLHDQATIPDGTYPLRIQSMSGDATPSVTLVFDPTSAEI